MNKKVSILLLSLFAVAAMNAAVAPVVAPAAQPTVGYYMDKARNMCNTGVALALSAYNSSAAFTARHKMASITAAGTAGLVGLVYGYKKLFGKPETTKQVTPSETWGTLAKRWTRNTAIGTAVLGAAVVANHYGLFGKAWQNCTLDNGKACGNYALSAGKSLASALVSKKIADSVVNKCTQLADKCQAWYNGSTPTEKPQHSQAGPETTVNASTTCRALTDIEKVQLKAWRRNAPAKSDRVSIAKFEELKAIEAAIVS